MKGAFENLKDRKKRETFSLKTQLGAVFTALMLAAILMAGVALYNQHRIAMRGADLAVREHRELGRSVQLRETLASIDRMIRQREVPTEEISRFRMLTRALEQDVQSNDKDQALQEIRARFERYISTTGASGAANTPRLSVREGFEDVSASVGAFIELNEASVYRLAENLKKEQQTWMKYAAGFLAVFLIVILGAAIKIITVVTEPLSHLAQLLDQVNVEDDFAPELSHVHSGVPEISLVARSFEQLLLRLRGYRALNVRRLLIEKRRADIIAASISDGIFLLRGDELLYVNPVAEKILGLNDGVTWKGMRLSTGLGNSSGFRSLNLALTQATPVEFSLSDGDRKRHYLLQSQSIPDELIEQMEYSVDDSIEKLLDRWEPNTLILAQDVTFVRESQEAKGHFIGTLSHEVKTPVTSLTMATRLLKKSIDQVPNPNHRALIETCASDVDRLRGLLEDLLSVSRFDVLTQKLKIQEVDVSKLVRQSVQFFQPQASEKSIQIAVEHKLQGRKVMVEMDAPKISWALSNLLTNALRHSQRGGKIEVEVEAFALETGEEVAQVHIRDFGPGIDTNRQERIFDKFNTYYDLRVGRSGSTGTGLAIAREIVQAHGGKIWVSSAPGKGAEFAFRLPVKARHSVALVEGLTTASQDATSQNIEAATQRRSGEALNNKALNKGE